MDPLGKDRKHRNSCDAEKGRNSKGLLGDLSHMLGAVEQLETMTKGMSFGSWGLLVSLKALSVGWGRQNRWGSSDGPGQKGGWAAGNGGAALVPGEAGKWRAGRPLQ